mmetsp:Transcript_56793/g.151543  ORF Transcript_56793/g.151543 Transcript_56793/m.151543 type:complete len:250 (-) Transcript_56793:601-1350(-)
MVRHPIHAHQPGALSNRGHGGTAGNNRQGAPGLIPGLLGGGRGNRDRQFVRAPVIAADPVDLTARLHGTLGVTLAQGPRRKASEAHPHRHPLALLREVVHRAADVSKLLAHEVGVSLVRNVHRKPRALLHGVDLLQRTHFRAGRDAEQGNGLRVSAGDRHSGRTILAPTQCVGTEVQRRLVPLAAHRVHDTVEILAGVLRELVQAGEAQRPAQHSALIQTEVVAAQREHLTSRHPTGLRHDLAVAGNEE